MIDFEVIDASLVVPLDLPCLYLVVGCANSGCPPPAAPSLNRKSLNLGVAGSLYRQAGPSM